ncbi:MAG TPA: hypothetical protein VFZ66_07050 [Herpetosiphonaceae bacterium]
MSTRPSFREAPAVRDLLNRSTWDELDRIAARYGVQFAGRRRALAIERLALVLERPDQLRAAYKILPEPTRAVLGLMLLLGGVEDERALSQARDRLVAARPELESLLMRVHIPNEMQTLASLGLCFRDRRRLVVPSEALSALPCQIAPARPGEPPHTQPSEYARLRYTLETLIAAIEQARPVAIPSHRASQDRAMPYQPLLLTHEAASELSRRINLPVAELLLLLSLLHAMGAVGVARGRWQVQPEWSTLRNQSPRELLTALIDAWQRPRPISDLSWTREFIWTCGPDVDGATVVGQHEANVRSTLWRWLLWCDQQPFGIASLAQTLAALHTPLFRLGDDNAIWIARTTGRSVPVEESALPEVALTIVRQLLHQLGRLGLVAADETSCERTPIAAWLHSETPLPDAVAPVQSVDATTLLVHPLLVDPRLMRLIEAAGQMLPPHGAHARYALAADGMVRLLEDDVPVAEFERALLQAGAQLTPPFQAQLALWAERAGRLRLHRPLTMIVTAEETPIAQVLAAAGVADAAEVLGPGCALVEPEHVEVALEQLRARGFWPLVVGAAATTERM